MIIVLDTNVLIAAFYSLPRRPSFSREVYDYVVENEDCFVSPYILGEFRRKCRDKLKLDPEFIAFLESLIKAKVAVYSPQKKRPKKDFSKAVLDKKDWPILQLASELNAHCLLTWDKELISCKNIRKTAILSPRAFWDRLSLS